ncbi:MAG TPA: hypothetical protein VNS79_03780 [Sphingobium sp.]|nr:hypothetical protein [Sphingobium sp.]
MTERARISQNDMSRATRAVKAAGFERARIVMDLNRQTIEVIIGEAANSPEPRRNPLDRLLKGEP